MLAHTLYRAIHALYHYSNNATSYSIRGLDYLRTASPGKEYIIQNSYEFPSDLDLVIFDFLLFLYH